MLPPGEFSLNSLMISIHFRHSLQSFITSTPHKSNLMRDAKESGLSLSSQNSKTQCKIKKQYSLAEFSDDDDLNTTVTVKKINTEVKEISDKKKSDKKSVNNSLNVMKTTFSILCEHIFKVHFVGKFL